MGKVTAEKIKQIRVEIGLTDDELSKIAAGEPLYATPLVENDQLIISLKREVPEEASSEADLGDLKTGESQAIEIPDEAVAEVAQ